MDASSVNFAAGMATITVTAQVAWSYFAFVAIFVIGIIAISARGDWAKASGMDKLILLGPIFYAAPLAAFGTEHFTITQSIASIIPQWIPWHVFWAYFVGACFVAAAFSLVTKIHARFAGLLLALTFFMFVALMDLPGWARDPRNRFALALAFRELSFGAGALALAGGISGEARGKFLVEVARYLIALTVLLYAFEQFRHGNYVPAIPLNRITPAWVCGHAMWTYVAALVYAVGGILLVLGVKSRAAAIWVGAAVLVVELAVYVPIAVAERASLTGLNFMADTLMFCGAVLLLAGALPQRSQPLLVPSQPHALKIEDQLSNP